MTNEETAKMLTARYLEGNSFFEVDILDVLQQKDKERKELIESVPCERKSLEDLRFPPTEDTG